MKPRLIIVGSGAMEVEINEAASLIGFEVANLDTVQNFLTIDGQNISTQNMGDEFLKLPIIMSTVDYVAFANLPPFKSWSKNRAQLLRDVEALGFKNWTSIVHPASVLASSAIIGDNVFIGANSTISSKSIIGSHTFINRSVSIGHDVNIGNFCFIAPGVTITGAVTIRDSGFVGAGSTIINSVVIGEGATVAAGSTVTRNVNDLSLVMGSPARQKNQFYRSLRKKFLARASKYLKILGLLAIAKKVYGKVR